MKLIQILKETPKRNSKRLIRITVDSASGGGNTLKFNKGDVIPVIRIESDGTAVVWGKALYGKRRVGILRHQYKFKS